MNTFQPKYNPIVYWAQKLGIEEMPVTRSIEWAILDISDSDIKNMPERIPTIAAQIFSCQFAAFARKGEAWHIRDAFGSLHWIGAIAVAENMQDASGRTTDHDAPTTWPSAFHYVTTPIADGALLLISALPIDTSKLTYFTRTVTAFYIRAQEISKKSQLAVTDPMTGVLNRRGLEEAISAISASYGIIYADLDNLKKINDTQSHEMGDAYISAAVQILKKSIRDPDILARVGGDEFIIIATTQRRDQDVDVQEALNTVVSRIQSNMNTTVNGIPLSMSIGSAIVPIDGDHDAAMRLADERMQKNKKDRKAGRQ